MLLIISLWGNCILIRTTVKLPIRLSVRDQDFHPIHAKSDIVDDISLGLDYRVRYIGVRSSRVALYSMDCPLVVVGDNRYLCLSEMEFAKNLSKLATTTKPIIRDEVICQPCFVVFHFPSILFLLAVTIEVLH